MSEKLTKAYADWHDAEEAYTQALQELDGAKPGRITLKAAMSLLELRGRANNRMDRYFKKALS